MIEPVVQVSPGAGVEAMRVIEVAMAMGFREQGIFSSAFKRRFGMTPSQWRRDCAEAVRNGHGCS